MTHSNDQGFKYYSPLEKLASPLFLTTTAQKIQWFCIFLPESAAYC